MIKLLRATVGHKRLNPKENSFAYAVYYVAHAIEQTPPHIPLFSFNRFNVFSVYQKDHGARTNDTTWRTWLTTLCAQEHITVAQDDTVTLISHPRLFGYAFNPISFWLIREKNTHLKAILCEVTNTFGNYHHYVLAHPDAREILPTDIFHAKKDLYVSPFTTVSPGRYTFSFTVTESDFKAVIDYFENDTHILNTYMGGTLVPLSTMRIVQSVLSYPLMTLLVVARIHYQAIRLWLKGVAPTLHTRLRTYQDGRVTRATKDKPPTA